MFHQWKMGSRYLSRHEFCFNEICTYLFYVILLSYMESTCLWQWKKKLVQNCFDLQFITRKCYQFDYLFPLFHYWVIIEYFTSFPFSFFSTHSFQFFISLFVYPLLQSILSYSIYFSYKLSVPWAFFGMIWYCI